MTMGHNVYVDLMNILGPSIYIRLACSIWEFSQGVVCGSFFIRLYRYIEILLTPI